MQVLLRHRGSSSAHGQQALPGSHWRMLQTSWTKLHCLLLQTFGNRICAWTRVMPGIGFFSGAALFCLYARARWSDFIHGNCIRLDVLDSTGKVAYADVEVQIHKTMKAAANKFKFLDLVVCGSGIFGDDWVRSWSDPFNNISVEPFSNEPGKTLMPAPYADGTALKEPWRVTRMIRLIDKTLLDLRAGYFNPDPMRVGKFNKDHAPDPSKYVGAISIFESDVGSAALEATVDEALDDAVQVVEDDTKSWKKSMSWAHLRTAMLRVWNTLLRLKFFSHQLRHQVSTLRSTSEPGHSTSLMPSILMELVVVECYIRTLQSPCNLGMTLRFAMCAEGIRWLEAALELNQKGRVKR